MATELSNTPFSPLHTAKLIFEKIETRSAIELWNAEAFEDMILATFFFGTVSLFALVLFRNKALFPFLEPKDWISIVCWQSRLRLENE